MTDVNTAIALITIDEYRTFAGIGHDNDKFDDNQAAFMINAVCQWTKDYIGRDLLSTNSPATEIFEGDADYRYYVNNQPLNSVTSLSYWGGTDWELLSTTSYDYTNDTTKVWFRDGNTFWRGTPSLNWKIVYTYGYGVDSVPSDLKRAACQMVKRTLLKADAGKEGIVTESFGDASTTYDLTALTSPDILEVLNRYRRVTFG